jgi:hypothetical protein
VTTQKEPEDMTLEELEAEIALERFYETGEGAAAKATATRRYYLPELIELARRKGASR